MKHRRGAEAPDSGSTTATHECLVEVLRLQSIQRLQRTFFEKCAGLVAGTRSQSRRARTLSKAFEGWIFSRLATSVGINTSSAPSKQPPILVRLPGGDGDVELQGKLVRAGLSRADAVDVASAMEAEAAACLRHIEKATAAASRSGGPHLSQHSQTKGRDKKARPLPSQTVQWERVGEFIHIQCCGEELQCSVARFQSLFSRFSGHKGTATGKTSNHRKFINAVACVLLRYLCLQGATRKGGGMQAAVPPRVLQLLSTAFSVTTECFASPLNCTLPTFCSMFLDTDKCFGSHGSFFDFTPRSGFFEANPPFDAAYVSAMYARVAKLLAAASKPLGFVAIFPHWPDKACWRKFNASTFKRHHVLVPKAGHWYTDGAQWMRATQRRSASFDTSVFWLANEAGAAAWKTALRNPDTKVLRAFSVDACRNSGVGAAEVGAGAGAGAGSGVGAGTGTRHRAGTSRHGNAQHATASAGRKRKRSVAKGVAPQSNWARLKATMQASSTKAARKRHPRKRERKKK